MIEEIHKKIGQIKELEERKVLKELLNNVFIEFEKYNKERYQELENKIFNEVTYVKDTYNIYTTIVKRENYDPLHYFLKPIISSDLESSEIYIDNILKDIFKNEEVFITKAFFRSDYMVFSKIIDKEILFEGILKTNIRDYKAKFKIRKNTSYFEKVFDLYTFFIKNNLPWKTLNIPYISKMIDIFLVDIEENINREEKLEGVVVDFGIYNSNVLYNMVPLWNVCEVILQGTGFSIPCNDNIYYEHRISVKEEGSNNGYLLKYTENDNIKEIKQIRDYLSIILVGRDNKTWPVYKIIAPKDSKIDKMEYEVFSNSQDVSFIEKISSNVLIKTKAELSRLINSFNLSKYLQFQNVKIFDKDMDSEVETYNMNYFIIDEIRDPDFNKKMVLFFTSNDTDSFIIRDILSFIVSEVQMHYPEYECEGKLL